MEKTKKAVVPIRPFILLSALICAIASPALAQSKSKSMANSNAAAAAQMNVPAPAASGASTSTVQGTAAAKPSKFGMSYFVFFNGPGIDPSRREAAPNQFGRNTDNGINTFNLVSMKYRINDNLAIDLQTRFNVFFNRATGVPEDSFSNFRWESPRIGISGKLASGDDWSLSGAVNTDFPYFLPSPLTGYTARQRQVAFNPGLFANFSYNPKGSRWSFGALLTPRFFVYNDFDALEPESRRGAFSGFNKPHVVLALFPTVNYQLAPKTQLTFMSSLDFRKHLGSSWNPFDVSLKTNGTDSAWRLHPVNVALGITQDISKNLKIFPYVETFPIAAQRINANTGSMAGFGETARVGMWMSGALF
jgi:hypothetical protein